jgi:chromate transporter
MFNFTAFLGAVTAGYAGSITAFLGLFGPGFILIFAMLPFWSRFRHLMWFKAVLNGLNASAIGLMAAGCITLYPKSVRTYADAMVFVLTAGLTFIHGTSSTTTILSGAIFGSVFSHTLLNVGQKHFYETM